MAIRQGCHRDEVCEGWAVVSRSITSRLRYDAIYERQNDRLEGTDMYGYVRRKKVFVSFDYEKDRRYYYLMKAWGANQSFEFMFSGYTSREIRSDSVAVVKRQLSAKIGLATHTLVIVGEDANRTHPDHWEIGYRNWQNYEVAKSAERGNRLVAVSINSNYEWPEELRGRNASWARSFSQDAIIDALNRA